MYTVCVREHFMIAHSFKGAVFGPAQRLHGATYVVDVELRRPELDDDGIVVDIGLAGAALGEVLAPLAYRNLDEDTTFAGRNSTTEVLARHIYDQLAGRIRAGGLGDSAHGISWMRVTLRESHVAWAAYEAPLTQ
jgi:6-pyruvoyl-tetrahydropterin synthase